MIVGIVLSMLKLVNYFKKVTHRVWRYFEIGLEWPGPPSTSSPTGVIRNLMKKATYISQLLS